MASYDVPTEDFPLSLLSIEVRDDCWCMLNRNVSVTAFPQHIAVAISEGIPTDIQLGTPCVWDVHFPWRPYTPAGLEYGTNVPWYFASSRSSYDPDASQQDFFSLYSSIQDLCSHYPEYRGPRPKYPDPISFVTDEDFFRSKEKMLDGLAFIAWWMAWLPNCTVSNYRSLSSSLIASLDKWNLDSVPRCGVIFDLRQDILTVNLPLWLSCYVPVFYKWTTANNDDPRFLKLSPFHYTTHHGAPRITFNDFLPAATTTSLARPISANNIPREGNFIIDFYGWKRRAVSKNDAKKYFRKLPFTTLTTPKGPRALFWRWKKSSSSASDSDDRQDYDDDLDGPLEQAVIVRELYRFHYSPHPGAHYDSTTGLPELSDGATSTLGVERLRASSDVVEHRGQWNMNDLATAVLHFPKHDMGDGKVSEVQLRLAVSKHPTWQIMDILDYALERRLNFQIMIPRSSPPQCSQHELYRPLEQEKDGDGKVQYGLLVEKWRARVDALLSRPHGRALAFIGGIEARIAADIGGAAFLDRGRLGPVLSGPGFYTWTSNGVTYYDDEATENDVSTLLGLVAPEPPQKVYRTLWPSTELLKGCLTDYDCHAEWNDACEAVFLAIKAEIEGPKPFPRTPTLWARFIKRNGAVQRYTGGLNKATAVEIHESFGSDWHGLRLSELT